MATYFKRRNSDRTTSVLTIVRVKGFKPTSRSFETMADAKAWAEPLEKELRDQAKHGGVRADIATLTVGKLIKEYLADPEVKALSSYENYHVKLDWWAAECAADRIVEFRVTAIRSVRDKLLRIKRTPATVNRHLSAMRGAWNWGRSAGLISMDRTWPSRLMLTEPAGRIRFLSDQELPRLLKAAEVDPVVHAAILVSLATGVRQGELLQLRWADIDLDGGKLTLLKTKNKTPRTVHVGSTAIDALRALKKAKVVSATQVFLNFHGAPMSKEVLDDRWTPIRTAAKLVNFRWHDLRHSCASILAQKGATLLEIGSVLGHKSPSMTLRYSHLVQGAPVKGHAELDALLRGK